MHQTLLTLAFVLSIAPHVRDRWGFSRPLPVDVAAAYAEVAAEDPFFGPDDRTADPRWTAVFLAVWTFHESGWDTKVHAKVPGACGATGHSCDSCGLGQTFCYKTPPDALGQARVVSEDMRASKRRCGSGPAAFAFYAGGRCDGLPARISAERSAEARRIGKALGL